MLKSIRTYLFYFLACLFFFFITASFVGEKYLNEAFAANITPEVMHYAYTDNLTDYIAGNKGRKDNGDNDYSKEYKLNDNDEAILKYQKILYYLDFFTEEPDGKFGESTEAAVKEYQGARALGKTGTLNKQTMQSLDNENVEYKVNKSSDEIKHYNKILYYLDFLKIEPDVKFTKDTTSAVEAYQKSRGLTVTGTLNAQTRTSLDEETLEYKISKSGDIIKKYQEKLQKLGYLDKKEKADGKFGASTQDAVKAFQKDNSLNQNGVLNKETMDAIDNKSK